MLVEPLAIAFTEPGMSSAKRQAFLAEDYKILRTVNAFPFAILKDFKRQGQDSLAIADPGQAFEATDVITDAALPRRRLIFAGVAKESAFVHYERGGFGLSFVIEFYHLESNQEAVGLWRGFCDRPAKSLDDLRLSIANGLCRGSE
ncbi:MAG TPA: hypothetical protein VN822_13610 [Candidatus Acidoferrales bacterium]|nr:hypothetical protein [Candidatus Acidoferrales bacterium]